MGSVIILTYISNSACHHYSIQKWPGPNPWELGQLGLKRNSDVKDSTHQNKQGYFCMHLERCEGCNEFGGEDISKCFDNSAFWLCCLWPERNRIESLTSQVKSHVPDRKPVQRGIGFMNGGNGGRILRDFRGFISQLFLGCVSIIISI